MKKKRVKGKEKGWGKPWRKDWCGNGKMLNLEEIYGKGEHVTEIWVRQDKHRRTRIGMEHQTEEVLLCLWSPPRTCFNMLFFLENVTLTLVFLLLLFDTPTWQCCLAWQWKRKREWFWLTWFIFVFLQRVFLSFAIWKCRAIWEGKTDLISHCTHYPRLVWRRENRGNNKIRVPFATVALIFRPPIYRHVGVSYFAVYPKLLVWNMLVVFVWVLRSCLIIVSSCAFYGYWCECVVFFMLKNNILVCFLVVGLHLRLVVEVVYVHYLCFVVMHVCGNMVYCCVLGFWFPCFLPLPTTMTSF